MHRLVGAQVEDGNADFTSAHFRFSWEERFESHWESTA
jgi:hypothetical protein